MWLGKKEDVEMVIKAGERRESLERRHSIRLLVSPFAKASDPCAWLFRGYGLFVGLDCRLMASCQNLMQCEPSIC
jgi:hypothetical protein